MEISRRELMQCLGIAGAACAAAAVGPSKAEANLPILGGHRPGWVTGHMTGAEALVETLMAEGTECVFGIPGAQENELWDTLKTKRLPYLLVTHEYSASTMADGYARVKGKPGVLCIVPGPGLTNALTGLGEALLDSIPLVAIVGDINNGPRGRPFQVHGLNQCALLQPVTKRVFQVQNVSEIPHAIRCAFQCAMTGEPGPVGVVIPYQMLIEAHRYHSGPMEPAAVPYNEEAANQAFGILANPRHKVGIYAGLGCMNYSASLVRLAELMQAPVATSISGKGTMPENHPLSVGWGYGPQATPTAEHVFRHVDTVLAIGVKYSEVSTGFYSQPQHANLVHVDINPDSMGRIMRTSVCVQSDAGVFLNQALTRCDQLRRNPDNRLVEMIRHHKQAEIRHQSEIHSRNCVDPMVFIRTLRNLTCPDALAFVDVTAAEHWATEAFSVCQPRTFHLPSNNQGMGWSIPAALGAQKVCPNRQVVTITGDGCFLMSAMEISTAAREGLPVKFFILDDHAYHYMQELQRPAYLRTTATILSRLDYRALAQGWCVGYQEITCNGDLETRIRNVLEHQGPVLCRVAINYGNRPIRWIRAVRNRYTSELTADQRLRFLSRISTRTLHLQQNND